jgi:hypothetical protein
MTFPADQIIAPKAPPWCGPRGANRGAGGEVEAPTPPTEGGSPYKEGFKALC